VEGLVNLKLKEKEKGNLKILLEILILNYHLKFIEVLTLILVLGLVFLVIVQNLEVLLYLYLLIINRILDPILINHNLKFKLNIILLL